MVARDFGDEVKRQKTLTKYTRTPNVLVVGCSPHPNPTIHEENRDAVAAAVQTLAARRQLARGGDVLVDPAADRLGQRPRAVRVRPRRPPRSP